MLQDIKLQPTKTNTVVKQQENSQDKPTEWENMPDPLKLIMASYLTDGDVEFSSNFVSHTAKMWCSLPQGKSMTFKSISTLFSAPFAIALTPFTLFADGKNLAQLAYNNTAEKEQETYRKITGNKK